MGAQVPKSDPRFHGRRRGRRLRARREELLATLHSLTNIRVIEDPESSTGWKMELGPFPGWQEVPVW